MTFFLFISDYIYIILLSDNKGKTNAMFTAIHPSTYRGGGILAHGVLNSTSRTNCIAINNATYAMALVDNVFLFIYKSPLSND